MNLIVRKYSNEDHFEKWNTFLKTAKNQTFLFDRNYMNYHNDRFEDHSLLVFDENEKLFACFPANEPGDNMIVSHGGLTYGGVVLQNNVKLPVVIHIFYEILRYYKNKGFDTLEYKAFPRFYNKYPADEIDYCIFIVHGHLNRRDVALVIDLENKFSCAGNIRREAKKAAASGCTIQVEKDYTAFWQKILEPNLKEKFDVAPVHSLEEIQFLAGGFHENIRLFTCRSGTGDIVAGTVIYETDQVAHCQYISASTEGRKIGALNLLFTTLTDNIFIRKRYFDFGIATENQGTILNKGLLAWKERMGGRSYCHDFYTIPTGNYSKLEKFLNK
jgi:hypothetical protein